MKRRKSGKRKIGAIITKPKKGALKELSVVVIKPKNKPRGRPFEKGNKIGNRFPPGISGRTLAKKPIENHSRVAEAARAFLATKAPGDPRNRTFAEVIVHIQGWRAALEGNLPAAEFIVERAEGKAQANLNLQRTNPMVEILEELRKGAPVVPPEGFIPRNDGEND